MATGLTETTATTRHPDVEAFELVQRQATALSKSGLVPKAYENNMASCLLAINVARRLQCEPLTVMQNLDIIHGRPSWRAQFLVASFNGSGKFTSIKYRFSGEPQKDDWSCVAYCTEIATGEVIEGPAVTWKMVKAEGWLEKNGSKWKTMPELMFRYRAAAFLVRTTAPEISMGFHTQDEVEDVRAAMAKRVEVQTLADVAKLAAPKEEAGPAFDTNEFLADLAAAKTAAEVDAVEAEWSAALPDGDARLAEVAGECETARAKVGGGK